MAQRYQNIMVAIDGSKEADLAFVKGVHSALRNDAKLTIAHVIDTRALQSVSTFDAEVYEELQVDAESLMKEYEKRAKDAGVADVHIVIEMGNPKTLLARTIPVAPTRKWTSSSLAQLVSTPLNASWSALHLNTYSAMLRSICWL